MNIKTIENSLCFSPLSRTCRKDDDFLIFNGGIVVIFILSFTKSSKNVVASSLNRSISPFMDDRLRLTISPVRQIDPINLAKGNLALNWH